MELDDVLACERAERLGRPFDRIGVRVLAECQARGDERRHVFRVGVLNLQPRQPLCSKAIDLLLLERGVQRDVGQQVHREIRGALRHGGRHERRVVVCIRAELAADAVNGARDVLRAARRGALREELGRDRRKAGLRGRMGDRAAVEHQRVRDERLPMVLDHEDGQAVRELLGLVRGEVELDRSAGRRRLRFLLRRDGADDQEGRDEMSKTHHVLRYFDCGITHSRVSFVETRYFWQTRWTSAAVTF